MRHDLDTTSPVRLADPVNRHHPMNRGRVAWWLAVPGLDGGRQWYDLMGQNHGTLTAMTAASGWRGTTRPGGWGQLLFDGTDDYVAAGVPAAIASPTVAAWINPASVAGGNFRSILTRRGAGGVPFALDQASNGTDLRFYLNSGGFRIWQTSGLALAANSWTRVVVAYVPGTGPAFYANGRPVTSTQTLGSDAPAIADAGTVPVWLGWYSGAGGSDSPWAGSLDDLTLVGRAWSAAEVASDYHLSRFGYPGQLNRVGRPAVAGAVGPAHPVIGSDVIGSRVVRRMRRSA